LITSNFKNLKYSLLYHVFICIIIIVSIIQHRGFCAERNSELTDSSLIVGSPLEKKREDLVEVAFFNVGQGNCTVVKTPEGKDIFIVDAGSRKFPHNIIDNEIDGIKYSDNNIIINNIVRWILNPISDKEKKKPHIKFILSHTDDDHQNYMVALGSLLKEKEYECFYYKHPVLDDSDIVSAMEQNDVTIEDPYEALRKDYLKKLSEYISSQEDADDEDWNPRSKKLKRKKKETKKEKKNKKKSKKDIQLPPINFPPVLR